MQTTGFTHVIFDLDGTLLDTLEDLAQAGNHLCRLHGWPTFETEEYRYKVGNGQPKLIERLMPAEFVGNQPVFEKALGEFRTFYAKHREDHTAPYPGILQMLDTLQEKHVSISILSNKDHTAVIPLVERYFGNRFELVQGRTDAYPAKPAAPITLHMLEELNAQPETTLYVGDSSVDIACGHNAGIRACGVLWGFRGRTELEEADADYVVDTPDELLQVILGSSR